MSAELTFSSCEPGERVSFLVRRFLFLKSEAQDGCFSDKHIPEGSCTLIFNFSGSVTMSIGDETCQLPPFFLTIPYPGYVSICATPPIDTFGVACKTSVFSAFFNVSLDNSDNPSFRPIDEVIPHQLWEQLKAAPSRQHRIDLFEKFILSIADGRAYLPDYIDHAYEKIYSSNGLIHINELIDDLNLNSRSFRRNFCRRVGISAKSLCRIVRNNQLLHLLEKSKEIDFQNMVYLGHYVDQPHLVNDFRKMVGESPGSFIHRDLKMVKLLSGL